MKKIIIILILAAVIIPPIAIQFSTQIFGDMQHEVIFLFWYEIISLISIIILTTIILKKHKEQQ